jgi:YD repeat-containing protein
LAFTYGHDAAGKTTTIGISQPAFEWLPSLSYARSYGVANELNQIGSAGGIGIGWNADGNMTSDGVNTYSWGYGNRMIGASRKGMTATYDYDSDDRRTKKTVNGVVTRTLWSGADELAEYDVNGDLIRRFVPDGTGAMDARLATVTPAGAVYWYHVDHQGTVIATSDSAGQTVGTASYSSYGEFGAGTSAPPQHSPFGYTGRRLRKLGGDLAERCIEPDARRFSRLTLDSTAAILFMRVSRVAPYPQSRAGGRDVRFWSENLPKAAAHCSARFLKLSVNFLIAFLLDLHSRRSKSGSRRVFSSGMMSATRLAIRCSDAISPSRVSCMSAQALRFLSLLLSAISERAASLRASSLSHFAFSSGVSGPL